MTDEEGLPTLTLNEPQDELHHLLRELQMILLKHPIAAQAMFRALVAEGRHFAQTEEGRRWKEALADSDLIRRGRVVWEVATLKLLEEDGPTLLPSRLLEAFMKVTTVAELEPFLARLFDTKTGDPDGDAADGR